MSPPKPTSSPQLYSPELPAVDSLTKRRARKNGAFDQFGPEERKVVFVFVFCQEVKGEGSLSCKTRFLLVLERERGEQRARHDCRAPPTDRARSRRRRFVGVNRIKE